MRGPLVSENQPDHVFALRTLEGALPIHAGITLEPTELGTPDCGRVAWSGARNHRGRGAW